MASMPTLRPGDKGTAVRRLQQLLRINGYAVTEDGDFGSKTATAVLQFQERKKVLQDGIVGPVTWELLGEAQQPDADATWKDVPTLLRTQRVQVLQHKNSYAYFTAREDVVPDLAAAHADLVALGGGLSSSGGLRSLTTPVGANQSAKSLHYLGLAIDLFVGGGMSDPAKDPYVIVVDDRDGRRYWQVFAHAPDAPFQTLEAWVHAKQTTTRVSRNLVNVTEVLAAHGYERIAARRTYSATNYGASEWWHFQHEKSLVPHVTRFGDELLKTYRLSQLQKAPPWKFRDAVWQKDWF